MHRSADVDELILTIHSAAGTQSQLRAICLTLRGGRRSNW